MWGGGVEAMGGCGGGVSGVGGVENGGHGGCVLSRGGLPLGCSSAPFSPRDLADALDLLETRPTQTVMVEREGGALVGRGGANAALAAAAARLAPHPPAATAELRLLGGAGSGGGWRLALAVTRSLAPLDELLVWPDSVLRALVGITPLAPQHIRGKCEYVCERCARVFEHPNPLKVHRFLRCGPPRPQALLRRLLAALEAVPPPAPAPYPRAALLTAGSGEVEGGAGAAVEALCAEWGARAVQLTGGHQCLYCGKVYSRRYGLKIHIRTHTGYRPLRCPHCARRFGDPSNLNKHLRLHTTAAPTATTALTPPRHRCGQCGVVTARRRDLERHHRTRHSSPG